MIISVIIPCYNAEDTISNCLQSIIDQSYSKIEIIVIDDGSTDSTKDIVGKIKDSRIKYFYQTNKGVSAARNYGLKVANGEFISFVDSDDSIHKDMLLMMHKYINIDDYSMAICNFDNKIKKNIPFLQGEYRIISNNSIRRHFLNNEVGGYLWNKLFRTSIIRENNILLNDEVHFMEDLLFCNTYITYSDKNAIFLNEKLYIYNQNETSITLSNYSSKKMTGIKALSLILSQINKSDPSFNLYYTYYYHFLLSIYVNGMFDNKVNKRKRKEFKSIILSCETGELTSKKVFWSVMLSKCSLHLYYYIWKYIKKGLKK